MEMIFRLFSYFAWLEWPCVIARWIRLEIGNNVIEKKYNTYIQYSRKVLEQDKKSSFFQFIVSFIK